jgi:hypothetical protein
MVLILIFAEVLGLYGFVLPLSMNMNNLSTLRSLIVALIMNTKAMSSTC